MNIKPTGKLIIVLCAILLTFFYLDLILDFIKWAANDTLGLTTLMFIMMIAIYIAFSPFTRRKILGFFWRFEDEVKFESQMEEFANTIDETKTQIEKCNH